MNANAEDDYKNSTMALIHAKKRMGSEADPAFLDGARRVLDFMYKLWQDQKMCDAVITSNAGCVQAHRVVLGAYSDTLNRTFQGYHSNDIVKLDLTDFRSEVVMAILNFMYTTELELNCHVIGQVLACANELAIDVVIQLCLDYLSAFDVNNAILHYSIAENNGLNEIRDKAFIFIVDNFTDVSFTRHFLYLPFERVMKIVSDKNLCVNSELDVFSAVVRWVNFDVRQRLMHGYQLLDGINFENLPPESIVQEVEAVGWIINNPECVKNYLYRAMKYNALKLGGSPLADDYIPRERICLKPNPEDQGGPPPPGWGQPPPGEMKRWSNEGPMGPAPPIQVAVSDGGPPQYSQDRQLSKHFRRTRRHDHEELQPDRGNDQWENEPMYRYGALQDGEQQNGRKFIFRPNPGNPQQGSSNNRSASARRQSTSSSVDAYRPTHGDLQSLQRRRELLKRQIAHVKQCQSSDVRGNPRHSSKSGQLPNKRKRNSAPGQQTPPQQFQQQAFPPLSSTPSDRSLPCIVAVGGIDLESIDPDTPGKHLFSYHSQYNRWRTLTGPMKRYIHHHGIGIIDGKLYVVGGAVYKSSHPENLGAATNEVHVFDPLYQSWYQAASMIYSRAYAAVVVWKNKLLVVGGEDSAKQKLDTIECYDPVANNWAVITQMPGGAKVGVCAAVLLDCLFVVGGYNKDREYGTVLADVECYDLLSQRWTILEPLQIPRCHASLIEVKRRLFLIGGRSAKTRQGVTSLSFVEEYDSSNDTWKRIANMETPRHDAGCTAVGSMIYIIGGMRSPNPNCLQSVECFNIVTGTWVKGVEDFPHPVAGIACCAMSAPNQNYSVF